MSVVKWKCGHCNKVLGSKQTVLYHLKTLHPDADKVNSFSKVLVDSDKENLSKKSQKSTVKKGKAFRYFSALDNLFNDDLVLESFKMGQSQSQAKSDTSIRSQPAEVEDENTVEEDNDFIEEQTLLDISDQSVQLTPPGTDSEISFATETLPDLDTLMLPLQTSSEYSHRYETVTDGYWEQDCYMETEQTSAEQGSISDVTRVVKTFKPPFKTRGHCDDPDCKGCRTEPCGNCHNCLNKKKNRLV